MKIELHTIIYKAAQEKFGVNSGSIVEENNLFTLTSDDNRTFTEKDFTESELDEAKSKLETEKAQLEADALAAKVAAEAKLAAIGLTTDDLKALGLGSN